MTTHQVQSTDDPVNSLQASFLRILPRIQRHGQFYFRGVRCHDKRQDYLCEMLALGWKWFVRLVEQGKDPAQFSSAIAVFAAKAVQSGRRLCGQESSKDVLSPSALVRRGLVVQSLPKTCSFYGEALAEALRDNRHTPPDEQAAFRLDWPSWLATRTDRDRGLIRDLMMGERTRDVAEKYRLSKARVSQLRHEYRDDWMWFRGELSNATS